jgi:hypothetical protein
MRRQDAKVAFSTKISLPRNHQDFVVVKILLLKVGVFILFLFKDVIFSSVLEFFVEKRITRAAETIQRLADAVFDYYLSELGHLTGIYRGIELD